VGKEFDRISPPRFGEEKKKKKEEKNISSNLIYPGSSRGKDPIFLFPGLNERGGGKEDALSVVSLTPRKTAATYSRAIASWKKEKGGMLLLLV